MVLNVLLKQGSITQSDLKLQLLLFTEHDWLDLHIHVFCFHCLKAWLPNKITNILKILKQAEVLIIFLPSTVQNASIQMQTVDFLST